MALTYADIADRVTAGQTDAQIANQLANSRVTHRDIPSVDLRNLIYVEWDWVVVDPVTKQQSGPLITLYNAGTTPAAVKKAIAVLLQHLQDPAATAVPTSRQKFAQAWAAIADRMSMTAGQIADITALHGGEKFAGLTAAEVTSVRLEHGRVTECGVARNILVAKWNEAYGAFMAAEYNGGSAAECQAAFDAAWNV